jgi:hypothetical protein
MERQKERRQKAETYSAVYMMAKEMLQYMNLGDLRALSRLIREQNKHLHWRDITEWVGIAVAP